LDPKNPLRSWFIFDESFGKPGYRRWANVGNLPELNLEHSDVQKHLWAGEDSIVKRYLKDGKDGDGNGGDGIDGWRLDAVQEIGFNHLRAITAAAHDAKKDACVVGEIWNYPEEWARCLDGVINFYLRGIVFELVEGKSSGQLAGRNIERMINDTGIDPLLKSWIVLDNHDTPRIKRQFPDDQLRRIAQVLQFTLPGSPVIYYGAELGMMSGNDDPTQRAPMRWDLVNDRNSDLAWMKKLIQLRKESSALRIGDFRLLDTKELLAFSRRTDHVAENVIVVVNPTALPVHEVIGTRESKLMSGGVLRDEINRSVTTRIDSGRLAVDVPAKTARVFKPVMPDAGRKYSPYKRVQ
jgi:glycosidase